MINTGTLWTYAIPCLVALLALGAVLSTVNHEPPGRHRGNPDKPRITQEMLNRATFVPANGDQLLVDHHDRVTILRAPTGPVEHIGATETTTAEDYAAPADPLGVLDTSADSVEAWLARWHAEYRDELQRKANNDPDVFHRLREPSDIELIEHTNMALRSVQFVCEDIAARLTSVAEAAVFDWRINTPTGEMPVIDTPAAERLAMAILEA